ncbi:MAG: ABC transporter substrate-binding protein [Bacteroidia bacterium]
MITKDQLNREIQLPNPPKRIISLVPSQTELLYDLGLKDRIVGQTIFCVHPESEFKNSIKIGGTKKLNIEKIISLKPDLIIANKEENEKDQIEEIAKHFPVWISDVDSFDDALEMIKSIGEITETENKATEIFNKITQSRDAFLKQYYPKQSVIYLIWNNPFIAVGKDTFINTMLNEASFENVITEIRYPEITLEEIEKINPDWVFLSSEPFPFKEEHKIELDKRLGKTKSVLVDGEIFSWYGSRLVKAWEYFGGLRMNP